MFGFRNAFGRTMRMLINKNIALQTRAFISTGWQNKVNFSFAEVAQQEIGNQREQFPGKRQPTLSQVSQEILHKLINVLISSPLIKLDPQLTRIFVEGIQHRGLPQSSFSSIIELLVARQNQGLLEGISRLELLKQMTLALETRIQSQVYELINRTDDTSQWIIQTNQKEAKTDQLHFELSVFSLTTGHVKMFGDHLILIKGQERIIQSLLYLQECPQIYRNSAVDYLKTLPLSDDLRSRLAEFTPSNTDPALVETE